MASTYTNNLRLEIQTLGENPNSWGTRLNNLLDHIDQTVAHVAVTVSNSVEHILTANNAASDQARHAIIEIVAAATVSTLTVVSVPVPQKIYKAVKVSLPSNSVGILFRGGGAGVTIANGESYPIFATSATTEVLIRKQPIERGGTGAETVTAAWDNIVVSASASTTYYGVTRFATTADMHNRSEWAALHPGILYEMQYLTPRAWQTYTSPVAGGVTTFAVSLGTNGHPPWLVVMEIQGGGGAGGGCSADSSRAAYAQGGGSGAYALLQMTPGTTQVSITFGARGIGSSLGVGTAGVTVEIHGMVTVFGGGPAGEYPIDASVNDQAVTFLGDTSEFHNGGALPVFNSSRTDLTMLYRCEGQSAFEGPIQFSNRFILNGAGGRTPGAFGLFGGNTRKYLTQITSASTAVSCSGITDGQDATNAWGAGGSGASSVRKTGSAKGGDGGLAVITFWSFY